MISQVQRCTVAQGGSTACAAATLWHFRSAPPCPHLGLHSLAWNGTLLPVKPIAGLQGGLGDMVPPACCVVLPPRCRRQSAGAASSRMSCTQGTGSSPPLGTRFSLSIPAKHLSAALWRPMASLRGERSVQAPAMLSTIRTGCRRSAAAARRALAQRLAPSGPSSGLSLHASSRGVHGRDQHACLSVSAAAMPPGQPGDGRRGAAAGSAAAASPAAVAAHTAHGPAKQQQLGARQPDLPHLRQLSEEQLAAVTAPLGTIRVVAGPGSGKVRPRRLCVLPPGTDPAQIVACQRQQKVHAAANSKRC